MTKKQVSSRTLAAFCAKEAEEKKAAEIVSLKVGELTTIADYFVLCTAQSEPQMKALANWIQKSVFEKFRQVDESATRNAGGTGLGLAITKLLAELQGGHVGLSSHVDIGSTFCFVIPEAK